MLTALIIVAGVANMDLSVATVARPSIGRHSRPRGCALAALIAFSIRQRRAHNPLYDLDVATRRTVSDAGMTVP
jgi:hypothetical protein